MNEMCYILEYMLLFGKYSRFKYLDNDNDFQNDKTFEHEMIMLQYYFTSLSYTCFKNRNLIFRQVSFNNFSCNVLSHSKFG